MQKKPGSDDKNQQHGDKKPGQHGFEKQQQGNNPQRSPEIPEINRQQQQGGYQPQQGGKPHEERKEQSFPPKSNQTGE